VAGGAGDVRFAVGAVVSDGGVAEHGGDGGAVTGPGLVSRWLVAGRNGGSRDDLPSPRATHPAKRGSRLTRPG
jgi:hypothetical protein